MLGSFLHNLRVPLRGHVMTGLSAALLSASNRRAPERGTLWRAGLVCAALKSVSPSAVLIGPMVAITAEGFLMELGTLVPGALGRALGGGLAMAWIPVHLAGRAVVLYGWDAAKLFEAAWGKASAPFGLTLSPWSLLGLLWLAHFAAGALSASIRLPEAAALKAQSSPATRPSTFSPAPPRLGPLSEMFWLDVVLLLVSLRLLKSLPLAGSAVWAVIVTAALAWLYPGAAKRLSRPGLWVGVILVAVAAGAVLGPGGVEAGIRMALRAVVLSACFAGLSQELAGPRVRARLSSWGAGPLLTAVEGAFISLPAVLARLPSPAESLRNPGAALSTLIDAAEPPAVFLVTGPSGSGKTDFLTKTVFVLSAKRSVKGILSPGRWKDGKRDGFDLEVIGESRRRELSRRDGPSEWPRLAGPFHFSTETIAQGRRALQDASDADIVVVDEVGPLELEGGGWAPELDRLAGQGKTMLWSVREGLVEAVQARWGVYAAQVFTPEDGYAVAATLMLR